MLRHGRFLVAVLRLCPQRGHKASPSATLPLLPARVAWPCATFSHWPNAMGQRVASLRWHCPPSAAQGVGVYGPCATSALA